MSNATRPPGQGNTPEGVSRGRISNALGPFGMVPAGVIESGLSDAAVRLYAYLWRRTNNENARRPRWDTIAAELGWHRSKAKRTAKELVDAELLTIVARHGEDGSQQTNDYLLEWASDTAPAVPYPVRAAAETPQEATPPPPPQEEPGGAAAEEPTPNPPAAMSVLGEGFTSEPGSTGEPGRGSPMHPKEDNHSLSPRGGARADGATRAATASPGARVLAAWVEAYNASHTTPPTDIAHRQARRVTEQLLDGGLAAEVAAAAARAAGAAGVPWLDRYVADVTRLPSAPPPGPPAAADRRPTSYGRTYGATLSPSATNGAGAAPRPSEQCSTHPGQPAANCGGCRADLIAAGDPPATRRIVARSTR